MDYENTDISKTLKKHMASNVKTKKIVLMVSVAAFALYCLIVGVVSLVQYKDRNSQDIKVNTLCPSTVQGGTCTFTISLAKAMKTPVYIYFDYENWFTSYFIYWKSMLMSDFVTTDLPAESRESCYPIQTNKDFKDRMTQLGLKNVPAAVQAAALSNPTANVYPCGLKAGIYSNMDTFAIADNTGTALTISTDGLYYSGYKDYIKNRSGNWVDVRDGRYVSWMIPAITAYGTKFLYGKINSTLAAGTYTITMVLNFKSSKLNYVPKVQLLSDPKALMNQNLGIILIVTAGLSIAIVILTFFLKSKLKRH